MIALHDDYKQQEVKKNSRSGSMRSSSKNALLQACRVASKVVLSALYDASHKLHQARAARKERKLDRLALEQLMQLDDALLKDMGIERHDLVAVKTGSLTLDALNKHDVVAARDVRSNSTFIWK